MCIEFRTLLHLAQWNSLWLMVANVCWLQTIRNYTSGSHKPWTWHTKELFGPAPAICYDDATITGRRLPTCLQVLRCMMYHCNKAANTDRPGDVGATSHFTTAKLVLQQIATIYEKANIPMVAYPSVDVVKRLSNLLPRTTSYVLSTSIVVTHQPLSISYRKLRKVSVCLHQPSNYGHRMLRLWSKMKRTVLPEIEENRQSRQRWTRYWHRKFPSVTVVLQLQQNKWSIHAWVKYQLLQYHRI